MTAAAPQLGSIAIPEAQHTQPVSPPSDLDAALAELTQAKDGWVAVSIPDRIRLLEHLMADTHAVGPRWVAAALAAKGVAPDVPQAAEEWLGGPMTTLRNLRLFRDTLDDIQTYGKPRLPNPAYTRDDGQVVAPVFPGNLQDKLMFSGFTAEIWMEPGVTLQSLPSTMAVTYSSPPSAGKVALVLGAGNVASIGPMDVLYKLFVENQVCILKMNPVNEYLGPFIAEAFASLIERDLLRMAYGGAVEGAYLCKHDLVEEIHITGSDKTHDAIVFGVGEEGRANKAAKTPVNTKRISSELGNVSGVIVVPGPWSDSDIAFQAANLASQLTNNGGFNCNATRVVVTHSDWSQRQALVDGIRGVFSAAPQREAYYPGAESRWDSFVAQHPDAAHQIGAKSGGKLPWTFISDLDPAQADEICFTTEAFCSVAGEVPLAADSAAAYVDRAVDFVNDTLWGTLNAAIIVHPESMKDPLIAAAVERGIANLRAGSVVVNHWPGISYGLVVTTWGAYPGHTVDDITSGAGVVHNSFMFDKPQKSVIRGPFRIKPTPPWFVTNKNAHKIAQKLTDYEAKPGWWSLLKIIGQALKG